MRRADPHEIARDSSKMLEEFGDRKLPTRRELNPELIWPAFALVAFLAWKGGLGDQERRDNRVPMHQ